MQRALDRDHDVTLFNRGQTAADLFPDATQIRGDRDHDLSGLDDGEWDATIDVCAYVPRQVTTLLDKLGKRAGHYTFISTISVFGNDVPNTGFTEDAPLLEPAFDDTMDMSKYGELKVGCEQKAAEATDRLLIIRPGFVIGPYDATKRFPYWVERVHDGGTMAAAVEDQPLQAVDGRDLAMFTIGAVEREVVDTVNVTAPDEAPSFREVLDQIAEGIGASRPDVRWVGERGEFPLTMPPDWFPKMRADISRARDHGLWTRPLTETARDTLGWIEAEKDAGTWERKDGIGLTAEDERQLIAAADLG